MQLTHEAQASCQPVAPSLVASANGSNAGAQRPSGNSAGVAGAAAPAGNGRNYLRRPPRSRYLLAFFRESLDLRKLFRRRQHRQPEPEQQRQTAEVDAPTAQREASAAQMAATSTVATAESPQVRQQSLSSRSTSVGVTNAAFTSSSPALDSLEMPCSLAPAASAAALPRAPPQAHHQQEHRSPATFLPAVQPAAHHEIA